MVLGYVLIVVLLGMLSALVGFLWSLAERSDERLPRFFQARYDVLRETVVRGPLGNSLTEGEDGKEGGEGEDEDSASGGAASEMDDTCLVLARRKRQATPARWSNLRYELMDNMEGLHVRMLQLDTFIWVVTLISTWFNYMRQSGGEGGNVSAGIVWAYVALFGNAIIIAAVVTMSLLCRHSLKLASRSGALPLLDDSERAAAMDSEQDAAAPRTNDTVKALYAVRSVAELRATLTHPKRYRAMLRRMYQLHLLWIVVYISIFVFVRMPCVEQLEHSPESDYEEWHFGQRFLASLPVMITFASWPFMLLFYCEDRVLLERFNL